MIQIGLDLFQSCTAETRHPYSFWEEGWSVWTTLFFWGWGQQCRALGLPSRKSCDSNERCCPLSCRGMQLKHLRCITSFNSYQHTVEWVYGPALEICWLVQGHTRVTQSDSKAISIGQFPKHCLLSIWPTVLEEVWRLASHVVFEYDGSKSCREPEDPGLNPDSTIHLVFELRKIPYVSERSPCL